MSDPYVVIELAGPPRGKGRPRFSVRGGFARAYTPAATRHYESSLSDAAIEAMAGRQPLDEALTVSLRAYMPVPTSWSRKKQLAALAGDIMPTGKPDFDNLMKTVDALNQIVWRDDSLVVTVEFMKCYDARPRLLIAVYKWF